MAFKRPVLPRLRRPMLPGHSQSQPAYQHLIQGLPVTSLKDLKILGPLGRGSYGHVSLCEKANETLVLKELINDEAEAQRLFAKEAKLLNSVNHDNIVKFHSICLDTESSPNKISFLMEYNRFDFTPLGQDYSVSSLKEFLSHVNTFDCTGFEHLNHFLANDICEGLSYLHNNDIVHRDLKPDNILVSNQHYTSLPDDELDKYWTSKPIVAKLTDFGESRAALVQTNSIVHTATAKLFRGSPAFMAPEIHQYNGLKKLDLSDLKATDMWSFAMLMFTLLNPSQKWPYQIEINEALSLGNPKPYNDVLQHLLRRKALPRHTKKYRGLRQTAWSRLLEAYTMCAKFGDRPSAASMLSFLAADNKSELTTVATDKVVTSENMEQVTGNDITSDIPIEVDPVVITPQVSGSVSSPTDCPHGENLTHAVPVDGNDSSTDELPSLDDDTSAGNDSVEQSLDRPTGCKRKLDGSTECDDETGSDTIEQQVKKAMCAEPKHLMVAIQGDFHQASPGRFRHEAAGTQCSTISLMAVIAATIGSHTKWTTADINNILLQGDREHCNVLRSLGWPRRRSNGLLDIDEFPSTIMYTLDGLDLKASIGILSDTSYCLTRDLRDVILSTFLEKPHNHFMLRMQDKCTAILVSDETGKYSIFDSHARDEEGNASADGTACIMHFDAVTDLIDYLERLGTGDSASQMDIIPVDVQILWNDISPEDKVDEDTPIVVGDISDESGDSSKVTSELPSSDAAARPNDNGGHSESKKMYKGDKYIPVYLSGKRERFTAAEAVEVLLQDTDKCSKLPLRVRENCAFIIDTSKLASPEDIKSDMNGTYQRLLRIATWTTTVNKLDNTVTSMERKKVDIKDATNGYHLSIHSKENHAGLCRSIFKVLDKHGEVVNNACLLQYHINSSLETKSVEFDVLPHGNRKHGDKPFYPLQKSTLNAIKTGLKEGESSAVVYNSVSRSEGGIMAVSHPGQIPRSRHQVYQCKVNLNQHDDLEELLLYVQTKEEKIVLDHQDLPEDLWILGTQQMCTDLHRFCTATQNSHPISVDPTFEFGPFEVTPFTYRHLLLKSKRSGVHPIFLGPTAIHHSKDTDTFERIVSSVTQSCPQLKTLPGFITDGETALYNAMADGFPLATGLRCFRHVHANCKKKLNEIGIKSKQDKKVFLDFVFGSKGRGGLVDCEDKEELCAMMNESKSSLDDCEGRIFGKTEGYTSKFWRYIKKKEDMFANHMISCQRRKAGMPCDETGRPNRSYTNQSESMNNKLTRQKEAVFNAAKRKTPIGKLSFVRNVWEEVITRQVDEVSRALCGRSDEYTLTDEAAYLAVTEEDFYCTWSEAGRNHYVNKFNTMTMDDVTSRKRITMQPESGPNRNYPPVNLFEPGFSDKLQNVADVSDVVANALVSEAEMLLKSPTAVSEMPTVAQNTVKKFLVASKASKQGFYTCTLYKDHVCCDCPSFKYQTVCKHSLCVAQQNGIAIEQLNFVTKRKTKKQKSKLLNPPQDAAGKKGGQHKNPWRPRQGVAETPERDGIGKPDRPFSNIHHNNIPFTVCFLSGEPKAKECKQCGVEFPRFQLIRPFDIVLAHREKWTYTTREEPNQRRISAQYTTRFYCVQASCIFQRFEYFNASLVAMDGDTKQRLSSSHKQLLKCELGLDIL